MKKKTLAIAVATAMMMSLVACGSGNNADHTNTTEIATVEVTETVDVTETTDVTETVDVTETTETVDVVTEEISDEIADSEESVVTDDAAVTDTTVKDVKTDSTVENESTKTTADASKSDSKQTQSNTKTDTSKSDSKQTQTDTKKPADTTAETKPAHTHSYTCKVTKNATCSTKGVKTYTCSCGASYTKEIAKTAHNYNSGKITKNPTCTSKGVKTYTCNGCGATYTEEIGVTSHSWKHYDAEYKTVTVTVQEAYDEDKYESHVICGGCGMDFGVGSDADLAVAEHTVMDFFDDCENWSVKQVKVGTVHHDAVTEQRQELVHAAYDKCTTCGKTK